MAEFIYPSGAQHCYGSFTATPGIQNGTYGSTNIKYDDVDKAGADGVYRFLDTNL